MMMKRKMPAVILAGLILLSLASCGKTATEDIRSSAPSEEKRITETVTDFTPETTVETALPADTESKTEATAEKEKAESTATLESGTTAENRKPAGSADKAETVPPTQAPKQSEAPKATEPPESRPAESTAPTAPPPTETNPEPESQPPKGFTEADHNRIVSEVKAYAESYKAKGFTFVWSDSLEFGWDVGWMGTPRISRDGVDGTIKTLKHHVDLIYKSGTDPANGVTADSVLYRVVQLEIDGGIAYAVIYG